MEPKRIARVIGVASLIPGALFLSDCNLALGLENFKDCPQDPSCPPGATCADGIKDGNETDIDCGGSCKACGGGKGCLTGSDCEDKVCSQGACLMLSCTDGVKNGTETDVDCGGSCPPCAEGQGCGQAADCKGMVCSGGKCQPTCTDHQKDGEETDVDCGGPTCPKCAVGKSCMSASDCATGVNGQPTCINSTCGFACASGYADCDSAVGCETDATTKSNCGACGVTCSAYCTSGACNDPVSIGNPLGSQHACAILKDGGVWCWGVNISGEVGDGTTTMRTLPTKVALPKPATSVSGGGAAGVYAQTCAVLTDSSLWCWGDNSAGQLGVGDSNSHVGPQKVPLSNIAQVAVGEGTVCAVDTSQNLYCWGDNSYGQVGNGTTTSPVEMPAKILSSVASVGGGLSHVCAAKTNGDVYCWGENALGELGNGMSGVNALKNPSPILIATQLLNNVAEVAAGDEFTCARDGTDLHCWGSNAFEQLGLGIPKTTSYLATPQAVTLPGVTRIAAGVYHAAALTPAGLFTWGDNMYGQLGDGTKQQRDIPTQISFSNAASIGPSWGNTCAITTSHQLFCWGDNTYGQLGNGNTSANSAPVAVVWP